MIAHYMNITSNICRVALTGTLLLPLLQCPTSATELGLLLDTVYVSGAGGPVTTSYVTAIGSKYVVQASGTFRYSFSNGRADAEFNALADDPLVWFEDFTLHGEQNAHELTIDGQFLNWLGSANGGGTWTVHTFSPNHVYRYYLDGTGSALSLYIYDPVKWDNAEGLTVTLHQASTPDAGTTAGLMAIGMLSLALIRKKHSTQL